MGTIVLISYLMPPALMFIALYFILVQLGLQNTLMSLMITYPSFAAVRDLADDGVLPLDPEELEDAAMIDGCNPDAGVLPSGPAAGAPGPAGGGDVRGDAGLERVPLRLHVHPQRRAVHAPVGLQGMIIGDVQPWGELMAASLMTAVPVIVIYMLGQKFMVAGLTAAASRADGGAKSGDGTERGVGRCDGRQRPVTGVS